MKYLAPKSFSYFPLRYGAPVLALVAAGLLACAGQRVRGLLLETASVVLGALLIALPVGVALALLITKTNAPGRRVAGWLLAALLFLPLYLHTAAWQAAFGQLGWWTQSFASDRPIDPLLEGRLGAAWIHGLAAVPWVTLLVGAALRSIDRAQEESALLDASPLQVLMKVTLRHAVAGAGVAALWVAVLVAGEMSVTDFLRVRTFAEEVYTQAVLGELFTSDPNPSAIGTNGLLAGLALLTLGGCVALALAVRWAPLNDDQATAWTWRMDRSRWAAGLVLGLLMTLLLVLPVFNLATQAGVTVDRVGDSWVRGWSATKLISAVAAAPWVFRRELGVTLALGLLVATAATAIGAVAGWALGRTKRFGWLAWVAIVVCLVIPGPVIGIGVIRLLNQSPDSPVAWLSRLYDLPLFAAWLAQLVRAAPIATLILWPALASVPPGVIAAARSDGAGWWGVLFRVAAPLRWRALVAAWLAALAVSVGELPATVLVNTPGYHTVTVRIFTLLHYGVEDRVAGGCLFMIGCFLAAAAVASRVVTPPRLENRTPRAIK